jgi:nucleoside-diphosphate-sugar epimerase
VRVLVTGVSGFIGSHIARHLATNGYDVEGNYRTANPVIEELIACGVKMIPGDLIHANLLSGSRDVVIHAAGASGAWFSHDEIEHSNIRGMMSLVEAARKWNVKKFIYCSSISLYGKIGVPFVNENTEPDNPDEYGKSKHFGEELLKRYADQMPALALRLPLVVGRGALSQGWFARLVEALKNEKEIRAFNINAPFNNAIHVLSLAEFIETTLYRDWSGFDVVVLGAKGTLTVGDVIKCLARRLGVKAQIRWVPSERPSFTLSSKHAIDNWGYEPMHIASIIDRYGMDSR